MQVQLNLDFTGGMVVSYQTCREFIAARVHQLGRPQKAIAADMDLSPSDLSRKLGTNPDDPRRFTLDDFERYLSTTSDLQPLYYLVEKYAANSGDEEAERLPFTGRLNSTRETGIDHESTPPVGDEPTPGYTARKAVTRRSCRLLRL